MANKKPRILTANFNMAVSPKEKSLIERAAKKCGLLPSIWARLLLVSHAQDTIKNLDPKVQK